MNDYKGQALITFSYDDGYRNNFTNALPLHEQYNIPATFNIVTDWVINDNRYAPVVTAADLLDMQARGFEIASHGVTHGIDPVRYPEYYPNGKTFDLMTDEEVEFELSESLLQLKEWGIDAKGLVLPYGRHASNKSLYEKYYEYTRSTRIGIERYPIQNRHDIPVNIYLDKNSSISEVKATIDDLIKRKAWIVVLLHHVIDVGETTVEQNSSYYTYKTQLEDLLQHVAAKTSEELLPAKTTEALSLLKYTGVKRIKNMINKSGNSGNILVKQDGKMVHASVLVKV